MEQLVQRADEISKGVIFSSLSEQMLMALRQWGESPSGNQFDVDFIPIPNEGDACVSQEIVALGGRMNRALVGSGWYIPKFCRCFWMTEYEGKYYYILFSWEGDINILQLTPECLEIVQFHKLPQVVLHMISLRFPLEVRVSFLKSSLSSSLANDVTNKTREVLSKKDTFLSKKKIDWEMLFHQLAGFIYGSMLRSQSRELEEMGCILERINHKSAKWYPPKGAFILGLKYRMSHDVCDDFGIVVYESPAYYIMKLKTGEEFILCHKESNIGIVEEIPVMLLEKIVEEFELLQ